MRLSEWWAAISVYKLARLVGSPTFKDGAKFGSSLDYSEFEPDGTLVSKGEAVCWRDEFNNLLKTGTNNPSAHLVQDLNEGVLIFKTTCDLGDWTIANIQLNHDRVLDSNINFHMHWLQHQANIPNWLLAYRFMQNGKTPGTTWTQKAIVSNVFDYVGPLTQISTFGNLTLPSEIGISDILQVKVFRDVSNASGLFAGSDPYTQDVGALFADAHIGVDMFGSHTPYAK